jgi:hypothetical protein
MRFSPKVNDLFSIVAGKRPNCHNYQIRSLLRKKRIANYISDIGGAIIHSQVNLFADDTLLSVSGENVDECIMKMQEDLNELSKWLKFNKLKLNVAKTKYMIITSRRRNPSNSTTLSIDSKQTEEVKNLKYLGVQIDNKLDFKENLNLAVEKDCKKNQFSCKLTFVTKVMIYKSIILPHLDYCSLIIFITSKQDINKLQLLQNRGLCIILKKPRRTNIKWMLDALKMLSVQQRVNYNTLILIFKIRNKMVPTYLQGEILYTREATTRTLRNADNFRLPRYQRSYTQNMMWHDGLQHFNELPTEAKRERNIERFKECACEFVS